MLVFHSSLSTLESAPSKVSFRESSSRLSGFLKYTEVSEAPGIQRVYRDSWSTQRILGFLEYTGIIGVPGVHTGYRGSWSTQMIPGFLEYTEDTGVPGVHRNFRCFCSPGAFRVCNGYRSTQFRVLSL